MSLNTYLFFDGNCREAFEFYRSVFGGDFELISTFADGPPDMNFGEAEKDKIMHVSYPLGESVLMGSDVPRAMSPTAPTSGSNFALSYQTSSREQTDELFAKLSDGGQVTMPLGDMFWGSYFGSCKDKFGIEWMLNYDTPQG